VNTKDNLQGSDRFRNNILGSDSRIVTVSRIEKHERLLNRKYMIRFWFSTDRNKYFI